MEKQRLVLPANSVPVGRFARTALIGLAYAVVVPLTLPILAGNGGLPSGVIAAVSVAAVGFGLYLFWLLGLAALRGMGRAPFAKLKRDQVVVSLIPLSVLGIPGRAVELDPVVPLQFRVRIFREQAKGNSKAKLVTVMLVELSQREVRVAKVRIGATQEASVVDWNEWARTQCQGFTEVSVAVEDTTATRSFREGPK